MQQKIVFTVFVMSDIVLKSVMFYNLLLPGMCKGNQWSGESDYKYCRNTLNFTGRVICSNKVPISRNNYVRHCMNQQILLNKTFNNHFNVYILNQSF